MRRYILIGIMATVIAFSGIAVAQNPPPANYGELADLLVENWEIPAASDPGDRDPSIAALDEIGIGESAQTSSIGITEMTYTGPIERWTELTNKFYFWLKVVVWECAELGNNPAFDIGQGTEAVQNLNELSQLNHECAVPCNICPGPPTLPFCPCPESGEITTQAIAPPAWCITNPNCL